MLHANRYVYQCPYATCWAGGMCILCQGPFSSFCRDFRLIPLGGAPLPSFGGVAGSSGKKRRGQGGEGEL